jgi:hypothetical protein
MIDRAPQTRVAFLLRYRTNMYDCDPYSYTCSSLPSGLLTSAQMVADMLADELRYETTLAQLPDSNAIDRFVAQWRPDVVIIEAYWVPPNKFADLTRLHPDVTWVVRNHSAIPFIALEGSVIDWSLRYMDYPGVYLSCNDQRTNREFRALYTAKRRLHDSARDLPMPVYLPNYYPHALRHQPRNFRGRFFDVGCFGAIRPLKNQLEQAVAAIKFAETRDIQLRFHINATRIEQSGDPVLKNLRSLFYHVPQHQLVAHPWMEREDFLDLCAQMDLGLQVSFSETFNITTADIVTSGVVVVVSPEITWIGDDYKASPNSSEDIVRAIHNAVRDQVWATRVNIAGLVSYDGEAVRRWKRFIQGAVA